MVDAIWFQFTVLGGTVFLAGLIGYLIARKQYQAVEIDQAGVLEYELSRQRRRATAADTRISRLKTDVERYRRKARR